jgi:hypothetical protein
MDQLPKWPFSEQNQKLLADAERKSAIRAGRGQHLSGESPSGLQGGWAKVHFKNFANHCKSLHWSKEQGKKRFSDVPNCANLFHGPRSACGKNAFGKRNGRSLFCNVRRIWCSELGVYRN